MPLATSKSSIPCNKESTKYWYKADFQQSPPVYQDINMAHIWVLWDWQGDASLKELVPPKMVGFWWL